MRQSIEELFEAGFLELENLVAPPMARSMYHGGQAPPPVGVMGEGQLGNLQRGLGSMNLKPSESLPTGFGPMSASSFPPARWTHLALHRRTVSITLLSLSRLRGFNIQGSCLAQDCKPCHCITWLSSDDQGTEGTSIQADTLIHLRRTASTNNRQGLFGCD
jgi:hypothetical protein